MPTESDKQSYWHGTIGKGWLGDRSDKQRYMHTLGTNAYKAD